MEKISKMLYHPDTTPLAVVNHPQHTRAALLAHAEGLQTPMDAIINTHDAAFDDPEWEARGATAKFLRDNNL